MIVSRELLDTVDRLAGTIPERGTTPAERALAARWVAVYLAGGRRHTWLPVELYGFAVGLLSRVQPAPPAVPVQRPALLRAA